MSPTLSDKTRRLLAHSIIILTSTARPPPSFLQRLRRSIARKIIVFFKEI